MNKKTKWIIIILFATVMTFLGLILLALVTSVPHYGTPVKRPVDRLE